MRVPPTLSLLVALMWTAGIRGNENAKRLFDDLMVNYNRLQRPARSPVDPVTIHLKLRLSQIIDVHEIDQIMTTSVWMKQVWVDQKLSWNPEHYGGVDVLYVPYEMIWVPDLVLYNTADPSFNITISTKATLHYSGEVTWEPPAVFKALCHIDVQWFPFDEQRCQLQIGSWTFPENLLRLELLDGEAVEEEVVNDKGKLENVTIVADGIDLSDYYPSVEWDILERKAQRRSRIYPSCCPGKETYMDITFYLLLRRKPLFYTVNLLFPCVGISLLTIIVFYLPSDSGEKISLCVQIVVALTLFFLLVMEIIPPKSITLPLIGKYLLFTMVMTTLSVIVTVISLNLHFRRPTTHRMSKTVRTVFLYWLPRLLFMRRPQNVDGDSFRRVHMRRTSRHERITYVSDRRISRCGPCPSPLSPRLQLLYQSPQATKAFQNMCFIAELMKKEDRDDKTEEDWRYVAMVLDRLFLFIFSFACIVSTCWILLQAPTLFDRRQAIDIQYLPSDFGHPQALAN